MSPDDDYSAPAEPAAAAVPSHIVLQDDWSGHLAGKVLAADVDLVSTLDVERIRYRTATERERAIGGV